jgi:enamine deaminase RidA (YjgF/YER057c/UK114 family)
VSRGERGEGHGAKGAQDDGKAIGMYSAGFEVDASRLVFVAGQVAIDGAGRIVGEGDFAAQAEQVFRNLAAVLGEAGCSFADIVKFTTYLTRHQDFAAFTEYRKAAYPRFFPDGIYPPNTGLVVTSLVRPELPRARPGPAPGAGESRQAMRSQVNVTVRDGPTAVGWGSPGASTGSTAVDGPVDPGVAVEPPIVVVPK